MKASEDEIRFNHIGLVTEVGADLLVAIRTSDRHFRFMPDPEFSPRLYRGETTFHNPCVPSVFRDGISPIDRCFAIGKWVELSALVDHHPATHDLKECRIGDLSFDLNIEAIAQHYGFRTRLMDFSRSKDVAMFFATCQYDPVTETYEPVRKGTAPPESVEFLGYLDKAQQELRPSGLVEGELAVSIAFFAFKAQRLRGNEMGRVMRSGRRGLDTEQLAKRVGFPWRETHHELLAEPLNEALLQRQVSDGWRRLAAPPGSGLAGDVLSIQDARLSTIFDEACRILSMRGLMQLAYEDFFMRLDAVMLEARSGASYLGQRVSKDGGEIFLVHYWLYRNSARVNACNQELMEEMMLEVYADERLMRANAYVSTRIRNDIETLQTVKEMKDRRDADLQASINRKRR